MFDNNYTRTLLRLLRDRLRCCWRGLLLLLLLLLLLRRVELEEIVNLGMEESLLAAGSGSITRFVRQCKGHILGGLVAEKMVALEMTNRFHYRLQVLARGVG
jgi:hypothetical protein